MRNLLASFLIFACALSTNAQSLTEQSEMSSQVWLKALNKMEAMCTLTETGWTNMRNGEQPWKLKEQLTYIHSGDIANPQCLENLLVLNKLQFVLPHVKVLFVQKSQASYPANVDELQKEMIRYDIGIPACLDTSISGCIPMQWEPRTLLVAPKGQQLGTIDGWHNIDKLIQQATVFTNFIMDVYAIKHKPFFGSLPSQHSKTPILRVPSNIAVDKGSKRIFVNDYLGNQVLILSEFGQLLDVVGTGRALHRDGKMEEAMLNGPRGMAFDANSNCLYIADARNRRIRKVDLIEMTVSTILGDGKVPETGTEKCLGAHGSMPYPMQLELEGDQLFFTTPNGLWQMDLRTQVAAQLSDSLSAAQGVSVWNGKPILTNTSHSEIVSIKEGVVTPLIQPQPAPGFGDGKKEEIQFDHPSGMAKVDDALLIADTYNHRIRKFHPKKLKAETIAGLTAGYANSDSALYFLPTDLAIMEEYAFIADMGNSTIRKMDLITGEVSNLKISEYEKLCYGYKPAIRELNDGPAYGVVNGENSITIEFKLPEGYKFDGSGVSYAEITTRKQNNLTVTDERLDNGSKNPEVDGEISFMLNVENSERPPQVTIDLHMYVQEDEPNGRSYHRATSYIIYFGQMTTMESKVINLEID